MLKTRGYFFKTKFDIENATLCPQNATLCPQNATLCPQNATLCPQNATLCPQNATLCPQNTTLCPQNATLSHKTPHYAHKAPHYAHKTYLFVLWDRQNKQTNKQNVFTCTTATGWSVRWGGAVVTVHYEINVTVSSSRGPVL